MVSHRRLSPGVEFNEIDRSQYGRTDYSITGTATHIAGFADSGLDYVTNWINTKSVFHELYGYPTNEPERYFYNGVCEILDRGGVAYATKLPYDNKAKDTYAAASYDVGLVEGDDAVLRALGAVDDSLTSYISVSLAEDGDGRVKADDLDRYRTGAAVVGKANQIKIVDITCARYEKARVLSGADGQEKTRLDLQCLGVVPVLVGSANSMFFRGLASSDVSVDPGTGLVGSLGIADFQPVSDMGSSPPRSDISVDDWAPSVMEYGESNFSLPLSAGTIYQDSLGKRAVDQFPAVVTLRRGAVEQKYTRHVGLAVFMAYRDESNESRIGFKLVEFFSGQLDRRAVDEQTGASDYICDKVNRDSRYVNMFSTVRPDLLSQAKATCVSGQTARSLGFYGQETYKHIDYAASIMEPLTRIFDRLQDPNQIQLDIMADAGLANLAQFVKDYKARGGDRSDGPGSGRQYYNADMYPFFEQADGQDLPWAMPYFQWDGAPAAWYTVMKKFDEFCKTTRKDCVFLADGFRPFVLSGNEKFQRQTNVGTCELGGVMPKILQNIRRMTPLDSSYSAGYSNWFYCPDARSGEYFWCPPSIKAAGVYTYNDAYGHVWSAPAGLTRGVVAGAADVAFNPYRDEAGEIYRQAWNYAVAYPMEGVVLEGQKTMQLQQTALDRVNVRRLMLYLERMVVEVARRFLYDGNTPFNRQRFVDQITPIFDDAVQGDGIREYAIRCDDELNDDQAVDNHEMRCIIGVVPVKTMEWIVCNFVIGSQSSDVSELVMQ